jgi:hypothetical protein
MKGHDTHGPPEDLPVGWSVQFHAAFLEQLLYRVEARLESGGVWRAKEMLRGTIRSGRSEATLSERYGQLLESVGDRLEAGKYLFLSGVRRPQYDSSLQPFVKRHSRGGAKSLVAQLPTSVRRRPLHELPPTVIAELTSLGVTPPMFARVTRRAPSRLGRWRRRAIALAARGVFFVFIVAAVIGMRAIVVWVRGLFG